MQQARPNPEVAARAKLVMGGDAYSGSGPAWGPAGPADSLGGEREEAGDPKIPIVLDSEQQPIGVRPCPASFASNFVSRIDSCIPAPALASATPGEHRQVGVRQSPHRTERALSTLSGDGNQITEASPPASPAPPPKVEAAPAAGPAASIPPVTKAKDEDDPVARLMSVSTSMSVSIPPRRHQKEWRARVVLGVPVHKNSEHVRDCRTARKGCTIVASSRAQRGTD